MATFINVTVGETSLLDQDRQQRDAQRQAALEQQRRSKLSAEKGKAAQEAAGKRVNRLPYLRDPAANRTPVGGAVMGVTYEVLVDDISARTVKLRVGNSDFQASAEVRGVYDPGLVTINDVTLPASGNNGTVVEAVGGIHYIDNRYVNSHQVWSGVDLSGVGSPPNLYQGSAAPPLTSRVDVWTAHYDTYSTDKSRVFALPAGGENCIFIYVHNTLKMFNTFRRIARRVQSSVNPRGQDGLAPPIYSGTWYDLRQENKTVFDYVNTQPFAAYQVFAFLVTAKSVTPVTLPSRFMDQIKKVCPPVTVNGTINRVLESGGGQVLGYGPGSTSYFFTLPGVIGPVPGIDDAAWEASALYENIPADNDVLAKQYGIGYINTTSHKGRFFSPAVFSYLQGLLTLTGTDAKQYPAMRLQLNSKPPVKFLAPCVPGCSTDDTEFSATKTVPATISTRVPNAQFKLERRYKVKRGEASRGTLYYTWDWDDKTYCRQQLAALGFPPLPYVT